MDIVFTIGIYLNSTYKCNLNEWKLSGEIAFGQYAFESENIKNNGIAAEFTLKPSKIVLIFHYL